MSASWPGNSALAFALDEAAIVAITDPAGSITYCNQKFCDISGYDRAELIGSNHRILNSGLHDRAFFKALYACVSKGGVWRGTIRNRRKDGEFYWVDTTIVPTLGTDGRPEHYTSIRFEVTAHMKALADLAAARAEAERAVETKDKFIANMSHEVRTPLNGVIGLAEALSATELTAQQAGMVGLIQNSGRALRRILDDILDISKIHARKLSIIVAPFDLREEINAAAELMRVRADEKGLGFHIDFGDQASGGFLGDAIRLRQIISNLASNAIKFTERGEVRIRADVTDEDDTGDGRAMLRIEVEDTGIGFDRQFAPRLFSPFAQADDSIARLYGGSGLGLSVCKDLAELMGGGIEARSAPGAGSLFTVHVPLERAREAAGPPAPAHDAVTPDSHLRILLAEDHPTNQKVVEYLLSPYGVELTVAGDGAEALALLEQQSFDLVLMDMQMPVMDGLTAIRTIRADEARRGGPRLPIAMMTANTSDAHHRQAAAVGADVFIAKPVTLQTLLDGVNRLLAPPDEEAGAGAGASERAA